MKRFSLSSAMVVTIIASGVFWVACGVKPPPPGPSAADLAAQARERARQDSIRAADEAARLALEAEEARRRAAEEEARRMAAEEEARRRAAEEEARRMAMLNVIYFDYDKSNVRNDQKGALDENARKLREYRPEDRVTIEGHCDERGTVEYNLALGERRAAVVRKYLVDSGIPAARITTISYGEERPAVVGDNEAAWSKNRRTELKRN